MVVGWGASENLPKVPSSLTPQTMSARLRFPARKLKYFAACRYPSRGGSLPPLRLETQ